jgi:hypothetical protein
MNNYQDCYSIAGLITTSRGRHMAPPSCKDPHGAARCTEGLPRAPSTALASFCPLLSPSASVWLNFSSQSWDTEMVPGSQANEPEAHVESLRARAAFVQFRANPHINWDFKQKPSPTLMPNRASIEKHSANNPHAVTLPPWGAALPSERAALVAVCSSLFFKNKHEITTRHAEPLPSAAAAQRYSPCLCLLRQRAAKNHPHPSSASLRRWHFQGSTFITNSPPQTTSAASFAPLYKKKRDKRNSELLRQHLPAQVGPTTSAGPPLLFRDLWSPPSHTVGLSGAAFCSPCSVNSSRHPACTAVVLLHSA